MAYLINRKANVEIRDERGFTPLHLAVTAGRIAIVRLLVNAGADVNAISSSGATPLALALKNRHREIAAFLSGARANGELPPSTSPLPSSRTPIAT